MTEVVDAQVHAWTRDGEDFPWRLDFGSAEANRRVAEHFEAETMPPERLLACMDDAGVDAAVVVSPTLYGADAAYARFTVAHDPARLAYVGLADPAQAEQDPGALAIKVAIYRDSTMESVEHGPLRAVLEAAERNGVPVCVYPPGYLDRLEPVVREFGDLQFVIDHLGLAQPAPLFPTIKGDGFERLPKLLRLAAYPNVAVKATGVPSLSREAFPFGDVWSPLLRVIDAFGCDRVMWETDFTRVERVSYADSVAYLREIDGLTEPELELLYGATARLVLRLAAVKVCVYGAGAIGGHAAAQLIDAGTSEVSVVARGDHLRAIADRGLVLRADGREIVARPVAATHDPSTLPPQDLVVVTLKAPALPEHADRIAGLLKPDGVALFITNGIPWWWKEPLPLLDPDGALWTALADRALGGVAHSNEIVEPGVVVHRARNRWLVGEPDGSDSPRLERVLTLFLQTTRLGVERAPDIRRAVWEKLVQNVAVSGISALTRLQTQPIVRDPALRRMVVALVDETLAVARALGWDLGREIDAEETARSFDVPDVTPSMLQDVLLGRPLEVEAIAGQVQVFGRDGGVPTPVLDVLVPLLRGLSRRAA